MSSLSSTRLSDGEAGPLSRNATPQHNPCSVANSIVSTPNSKLDDSNSTLGRDYTAELEVAQPQKTFHGFPKLPKELRLDIWDLAAFIPRSIVLTERPFSFPGWYRSPESDECLPYYISSPTAPPILHTCYESRVQALRYYKREFEVNEAWTSSNNQSSSLIRSSPPTIYIN
jgi:hypothetical protein